MNHIQFKHIITNNLKQIIAIGIVYILCVLNAYSQQTKQVKFLDEANAPIEDVMVFHNGYFVGITDE